MKGTGGNIGPIAALVAAATVVAAYAVYLLADYSANMTDTGYFDSLIVQKFASDEPVRNYADKRIMEKMKPMEPLLDIIAGYENDLQAEYNSMKNELAEYDIESILTMSIDFPDSIAPAKVKLNVISSIHAKYRANFSRISGKAAIAMNGVIPAGAAQKPLADSLYALVAGGDRNINEYFLIQDSIINHITKLQTFLSDNRGKYKLIGEEIKFISKKEQNVFTKYGNRLLELWQKEREWIFRIKQQEGIVDEKIHTQIEDFLL